MKDIFYFDKVTKQVGGGGKFSFTPMKRGGRKVFSQAEGGAQNVLTHELEVLAIMIEGVRKKVPPFLRGACRILPFLEGGAKVSDSQFSHFVTSPPPCN